MDPLVAGDSSSKIARKGRPATDRAARELIEILGPGVSRYLVGFTWPEKGGATLGSEAAKGYVGFCLTHGVTAQDLNPKVLELEADEAVDNVVVFRAAEAIEGVSAFVNKSVRGQPLVK